MPSRSTAATVMAVLALAGDTMQASRFELPALATTITWCLAAKRDTATRRRREGWAGAGGLWIRRSGGKGPPGATGTWRRRRACWRTRPAVAAWLPAWLLPGPHSGRALGAARSHHQPGEELPSCAPGCLISRPPTHPPASPAGRSHGQHRSPSPPLPPAPQPPPSWSQHGQHGQHRRPPTPSPSPSPTPARELTHLTARPPPR